MSCILETPSLKRKIDQLEAANATMAQTIIELQKVHNTMQILGTISLTDGKKSNLEYPQYSLLSYHPPCENSPLQYPVQQHLPPFKKNRLMQPTYQLQVPPTQLLKQPQPLLYKRVK